MKQVFLYTLLFLLQSIAYAQNPNEFTLNIKNIEVNDGGKQIKRDTMITKKIYLDMENRFVLYDNGTYRYCVMICMARSGNRIKVEEKNYVTDQNNQTVASGKLKKEVQFINVSMPGKFQNTCGEYLLLDKATFKSMGVSFLREVYYGMNQPQ